MDDPLCLSLKAGGYGELILLPSERYKCLLLQTKCLNVPGSERACTGKIRAWTAPVEKGGDLKEECLFPASPSQPRAREVNKKLHTHRGR